MTERRTNHEITSLLHDRRIDSLDKVLERVKKINSSSRNDENQMHRFPSYLSVCVCVFFLWLLSLSMQRRVEFGMLYLDALEWMLPTLFRGCKESDLWTMRLLLMVN